MNAHMVVCSEETTAGRLAEDGWQLVSVDYRGYAMEAPASLFASGDPLDGIDQWANEGGSVAFEESAR